MEKLGLSFHNTRALHQKIDSIPNRGGEWITKNIRFHDLPDQKFTIRYRDPVKAIQSLWSDPSNSEHFVYAPEKVYTDNTKASRIFSEMWTGKWWHAVQVRYHNHISRTNFL